MTLKFSVVFQVVTRAHDEQREHRLHADGEGSTEPSRDSQDQISANAKQKFELYGSFCLFLARAIDLAHSTLPHLITLIEQLLG